MRQDRPHGLLRAHRTDDVPGHRHTGGAWTLDEQHIAPALGLLAHVVETDRDARRETGAASWPGSPTTSSARSPSTRSRRPSTCSPRPHIELVEATLSHGGRDPSCCAPGWSAPRHRALSRQRTRAIPAPDESRTWDPTTVWPGGFIGSADLRASRRTRPRRLLGAHRRSRSSPGAVSATRRGRRPARHRQRHDRSRGPREVAFPNLDLTAHLSAAPPGWLGFDTTVTFGCNGIGVTSTSSTTTAARSARSSRSSPSARTAESRCGLSRSGRTSGGPGAGLGRLDRPVLGWRGRDELAEELGSRPRPRKRRVERLLVRLRRLGNPLTLRTYWSAAA